MAATHVSGLRWGVLMALLLGAGALGGCGSTDDALSLEQQLSKLAGHQLSATEVDEMLALADSMCGFDTKVLTEIWIKLDARQLEFQDYVFGQHCPDRLAIYEQARPTTGAVPDVIALNDEAPTDDLPPDDLPTELLESITARRSTTTTRAQTTSSTTRPSTSSTRAQTTSSTTRQRSTR